MLNEAAGQFDQSPPQYYTPSNPYLEYPFRGEPNSPPPTPDRRPDPPHPKPKLSLKRSRTASEPAPQQDISSKQPRMSETTPALPMEEDPAPDATLAHPDDNAQELNIYPLDLSKAPHLFKGLFLEDLFRNVTAASREKILKLDPKSTIFIIECGKGYEGTRTSRQAERLENAISRALPNSPDVEVFPPTPKTNPAPNQKNAYPHFLVATNLSHKCCQLLIKTKGASIGHDAFLFLPTPLPKPTYLVSMRLAIASKTSRRATRLISQAITQLLNNPKYVTKATAAGHTGPSEDLSKGLEVILREYEPGTNGSAVFACIYGINPGITPEQQLAWVNQFENVPLDVDGVGQGTLIHFKSKSCYECKEFTHTTRACDLVSVVDPLREKANAEATSTLAPTNAAEAEQAAEDTTRQEARTVARANAAAAQAT
ncbi:hypothetical protein DL93DRAFT_2166274 [Clavulina sp. PMI_390]|nr:hypothetical protein DL93DRAFT_2166274 [Clavulina sp. PMI_390]